MTTACGKYFIEYAVDFNGQEGDQFFMGVHDSLEQAQASAAKSNSEEEAKAVREYLYITEGPLDMGEIWDRFDV